jgi:hypothetical protein
MHAAEFVVRAKRADADGRGPIGRRVVAGHTAYAIRLVADRSLMRPAGASDTNAGYAASVGRSRIAPRARARATSTETTMTMREIADLRDESTLKRHYRALLTPGELLTCSCWGLLLALCVLQEAVETLFA